MSDDTIRVEFGARRQGKSLAAAMMRDAAIAAGKTVVVYSSGNRCVVHPFKRPS